jgi:hypothetical protein
MKSEMEKMKPIVGLFLEGLMLVFIFVYSHNTLTADTQDTHDSPLKNGFSLHEVVIRSGWSSESLSKVIPHLPTILSTIFPPVSRDKASTSIAMCDALSVNSFERNTFYIIASDNVP